MQNFQGLFGMSLLLALPPGLQWQEPMTMETIGSEQATPGGTLVSSITNFPLTMRKVGPDSSHTFRRLLSDNDFSLVTQHPNQPGWIPTLASAWAVAADHKTVYYRLNPDAAWSDGKAVTARDFVYTLDFMRSPEIQSPWANNYYAQQFEKIDVYRDKNDAEVIGITLRNKAIDPIQETNLKPTPAHFYQPLDKDFPKKFNWAIAPNTGAYQITAVDRGNRITFTRKSPWWGDRLKFFQKRFNVQQIIFKVIPDIMTTYEYLKAGEVDVMPITSPDLWAASGRDEVFAKGYIHRLQAYHDTPRDDYVLILNQAMEPFQDKRVREAFAHCLNIDRIIKQLLNSDFERLQGISQGYGPYTKPGLQPRAFDPKRVEQLLDQAGWNQRNADGIRIKDKKPLLIRLAYSQSNLAPRLLLMQEDARRAGFDLQLTLGDPATVFRSYREKNQHLAFMIWPATDQPEYSHRFLSNLAGQGPNNNFSNTADPGLDRLILDYDNAESETVRITKAHEIQQKIFDEATHIPLFEVTYYRLAYWGWLRFPTQSGTRITDSLSYFDPAIGGLFWIDAARKTLIRESFSSHRPLAPQTWVDESHRVH